MSAVIRFSLALLCLGIILSAQAQTTTERHVVNFMRSTTAAATNSNLNVSTAVNIVNLNATTCTLEVRFFRNFSSSAACTVSRSVSAGQSVTFCSRDVGARDDFIACSNVCDPELEFHQGRAIVASADNCPALSVAALLLFTDNEDRETLASARVSVLDLATLEPLIFGDGFEAAVP